MAADLPKEFDVVVLGTGIPESIVAAAFSRIGQTVLHLDRNEYYSGDWASFNLEGIEKWQQLHQSEDASSVEGKVSRPDVDESSLLEEGESLVQMPLHNSNFSHVDMQFFVREEEVTATPDVLQKVPADDDEVEGMKDLHVSSDKPEQEVENQEGTQSEVVSSKSENQSGDVGSETSDAALTETTEACQGTLNIANVDRSQVSDDGNSSGDSLKEESEQTSKETIEEVNQDTAVDKSTVSKAVEIPCDNGEKEAEAGDQDVGNVLQDASQVKSETEGVKDKKWTVQMLKSEWRKFNLDLSPKVVYSGGDMVELLISSDIAKYCEFKTITRVLTLLNGSLERVPCSRSDVFSSKKVSMLEKRMLMKFLQFCIEYENKADEIKDFLDKPFVDFLTSRKLTVNVKHYIQHSIAMATDSMTTQQGLSQMKKFLKSLGRYGNTAFLWSLYGSGELPQSFCRMCAVFGGIYCLRMSASSLVMDTAENKCKGIITTEGQKIQCKWLIMESSYAPARYISQDNSKTISRAIIMADRPLLPTDQQELSLMCLPCPDDGDRPVYVLELPPSSMASPQHVYIFHLTRKGNKDVMPKEDLSYAVETLFKNDDSSEEEKPVILWSLYFTQCDMSKVQPSDQLPSNVILMAGPGTEIDIDRPVQEAKDVFKRILPDEEFLPKAPNPEDIIYVDDTEAQVTEGNSHSEFKESETDPSEKDRDEKDHHDQSESKDEKDIDQSEIKDEKDIDQSERQKDSKETDNQSDITTENVTEDPTRNGSPEVVQE